MSDSPALLRAARLFGRLQALDLLQEAEIHHHLVAAAAGSGPRMRALHAWHDSRDHHARRRAIAVQRVAQAVRPALAAWSSAEVILRLAAEAGSDALPAGEAQAIAAGLAARQLRR